MKKYIIIKADTNDADYVHSKNLISDEQISAIMPLIEAIRSCGNSHNYPIGECSSVRENLAKLYPEFYEKETDEDDEEYFEYVPVVNASIIFDQFIPNFDYGIHTIVSIEILTVTNEEKLL